MIKNTVVLAPTRVARRTYELVLARDAANVRFWPIADVAKVTQECLSLGQKRSNPRI